MRLSEGKGFSTVVCGDSAIVVFPFCFVGRMMCLHELMTFFSCLFQAACTTSEEDMDRNNIEMKWSGERKMYLKSGDFVEFDCKIGHVQDPASSPFRVQCVDGILEYPWCKPGSKSPPLCHCLAAALVDF